MPNVATNYTDPTGVEYLNDVIPYTAPNKGISLPIYPVKYLLVKAPLIMSNYVSQPDAHVVVYIPIPQPLQAVDALTTYPAIYKTFGGEVLAIQTPRVYPPIYVSTAR